MMHAQSPAVNFLYYQTPIYSARFRSRAKGCSLHVKNSYMHLQRDGNEALRMSPVTCSEQMCLCISFILAGDHYNGLFENLAPGSCW